MQFNLLPDTWRHWIACIMLAKAARSAGDHAKARAYARQARWLWKERVDTHGRANRWRPLQAYWANRHG